MDIIKTVVDAARNVKVKLANVMLFDACEKGDFKKAEKAINYGADVNATKEIEGLRYLEKYDVDLEVSGPLYGTPAYIAMKNYNKEIFDLIRSQKSFNPKCVAYGMVHDRMGNELQNEYSDGDIDEHGEYHEYPSRRHDLDITKAANEALAPYFAQKSENPQEAENKRFEMAEHVNAYLKNTGKGRLRGDITHKFEYRSVVKNPRVHGTEYCV